MIRTQTFGLTELIAALDQTHDDIEERAAQITKQAVGRIKNDAKAQIIAAHYRTLPHLARSFTSELTSRNQREVVGEAGASWELPQGRLDVFIEHGSPTSNPHPHWLPAAEREIPRWIDELENALVEDLDR
jgi:hypothetical protein